MVLLLWKHFVFRLFLMFIPPSSAALHSKISNQKIQCCLPGNTGCRCHLWMPAAWPELILSICRQNVVDVFSHKSIVSEGILFPSRTRYTSIPVLVLVPEHFLPAHSQSTDCSLTTQRFSVWELYRFATNLPHSTSHLLALPPCRVSFLPSFLTLHWKTRFSWHVSTSLHRGVVWFSTVLLSSQIQRNTEQIWADFTSQNLFISVVVWTRQLV